MSTSEDRFRGALLGLAVGDAVGTTVEFKAPGTFPPVTDMVGGGPFGLEPGQWTDDTSMALCLAESLLEVGDFDPVDQLERYVRWFRKGHWSSTGRCFDIGRATRLALQRFEKTGEPFPGDVATDAAGNGPLMKLAPVPMAYAHAPELAEHYAELSARTTHGAPEAAECARTFARLLVLALNGATKGEILDAAPPITDTPRGNGYVVLALDAALWAFAAHDDYRSTILAAVNLGDDADTTAAIAGQLAGAHLGAQAIPGEWLGKLHRRDEITELADRLAQLDPPERST